MFQGLDENLVFPNPIDQFAQWYNDAQNAQELEPNAMVLATYLPGDYPSARWVLMKEFSTRGWVFFTNYESRKGQELRANPKASLTFYWTSLGRQVRIAGDVGPIDSEESARYFATRPLDSRIGAWASPQSRPLHSRQELVSLFEQKNQEFGQLETIPLPPHWGGYLLQPVYLEFWLFQDHRLHDRIAYQKEAEQAWRIQRLAP